MISEEERKERCKKLSTEISMWIDSEPNKTLSRLRRFYDSIISIHLGGEGIMERHNLIMNNDASLQKVKDNWRNYKVNYPNKLNCEICNKDTELFLVEKRFICKGCMAKEAIKKNSGKLYEKYIEEMNKKDV